MNVNTEYEILVQEIFQAINSTQDVQTVEVEHNKKIKGISGCEHQIDVYWEFTHLGELYRTAIECKNHSKPVAIGKIRDFKGVIDDIGDTKGIFVSKSGFQSGAKQFAEAYGISLKEIRLPTETDYGDTIRNFQFNITIKPHPSNIRIDVIWDEEWGKKNYPPGTEVKGWIDPNKDNIVNSSGELVRSIFSIKEELLAQQSHDHSQEDIVVSHLLGADAYIYLGAHKVKILQINFTYDWVSESHSKPLFIRGDDVIKAIIKDVKSGNKLWVHRDNSIH